MRPLVIFNEQGTNHPGSRVIVIDIQLFQLTAAKQQ
jgi:hypothetical protein